MEAASIAAYHSPMTLALAIAALVVSVISLAFTAYQWRRSGPQLAIEQVDANFRDGKAFLTAEILSVGRIAATVSKVEGWSGDKAEVEVRATGGLALGIKSSRTGMQLVSASLNLPARLEPSDVLEVSFALPDKQNVDFLVWVTAKSGRAWAETRRQIRYQVREGGASFSLSR